MKKTINILCATDDNYAPYCGIMLTSLFESNKESQFEVYVFLDGDLSNRNIAKFRKLEQLYGNRVLLMTIDNELLKDCPVNRLNNSGSHTHITLPTYYRLLASELLPQTVKKIIYLDCDIVVKGDIKPLWRVEMSNLALAAIKDCDSEYNHHRLGYPVEYAYFNAGVAVYNLDYWRNNGVREIVLEYIGQNADKLQLMDQDALNGSLYDKVVLLPERLNFQVFAFYYPLWEKYNEQIRNNYCKESREAIVIHYNGWIKPWGDGYFGPYFSAWDDIRKKSLWRKVSRNKMSIKHIKYLIKVVFLPKMLKEKKDQWIITEENRVCYER